MLTQIRVGDFHTPLTAMDRTCKQQSHKDTMAWNDTMEQMDLTDLFRTLHSNTAEYTFFSSAHGTFSRTDHILGHKAGLNNYKKDSDHTMHLFRLQGYET